MEKLKESVVDVSIRMEFGAAIAAATDAFALSISDRKLKLQSVGNKFSVVF